VSRLIGLLLGAIGLGFIGLFLFLRIHGELSGDFKISAVMVGCGVGLIWISLSWLMSKQVPTSIEPNDKFERNEYVAIHWLKLRRPGEIIAGVGCAAMLSHAIAISTHTGGLPNWLLGIVIGTPVVLAWFVAHILVPGAFPSEMYPDSVLLRMSVITRFFVNVLTRAGWFGYVGILFIWFRLQYVFSPYWRLTSEVFASILISLLFASQLLMLHYGQLRKTTVND
jgi:hypothetical protein